MRQSSEPFDFVRTLRMAGYGMIILGPTLHFWFNFMSKLFPRTDLFSTLMKMVMGQTLYGPAMTVIFFSFNAHLQGMSNSHSIIFVMQFLFIYCIWISLAYLIFWEDFFLDIIILPFFLFNISFFYS